VTSFRWLSVDGVPPEDGAPEPSRVVRGAPRFRTWSLEARDGLYAGIWESTPGAWRVVYDEWEYCRILSGVSVLTEDGAAPRTVRAGDAFVLRPGFTGIWEVVETTRKEYVVRVAA
jgi:uncharacterized protein